MYRELGFYIAIAVGIDDISIPCQQFCQCEVVYGLRQQSIQRVYIDTLGF